MCVPPPPAVPSPAVPVSLGLIPSTLHAVAILAHGVGINRTSPPGPNVRSRRFRWHMLPPSIEGRDVKLPAPERVHQIVRTGNMPPGASEGSGEGLRRVGGERPRAGAVGRVSS